ncbi:unnamed protein product [Aphanomyces euteiches]
MQGFNAANPVGSSLNLSRYMERGQTEPRKRRPRLDEGKKPIEIAQKDVGASKIQRDKVRHLVQLIHKESGRTFAWGIERNVLDGEHGDGLCEPLVKFDHIMVMKAPLDESRIVDMKDVDRRKEARDAPECRDQQWPQQA